MKYVCISSGADSTALALLLWERGEDFEMVFSDTGAELPETYWLLPKIELYIGKKMHVVSNGSFYQWLQKRGYMLPGPSVRWCTGDLKQKPMDRFFDKVGDCIVCNGIRADEPQRVREKGNKKNQHLEYPLVDEGMGKEDVKSLCEKHGLLSPAYKWRKNVSCFCCPFQCKQDWLNMLREHPHLYSIAEVWEEESVARGYYRWRKNFSLKALREADESQLKLWPEMDEEPCSICRW